MLPSQIFKKMSIVLMIVAKLCSRASVILVQVVVKLLL